jgi:RNA polymerase sigma-70 factor (ECF subfamily)
MQEGITMKINEQNFIAQLCKGNEKALEYVVHTYGGLIYSVVRKQLSVLPELQQECVNDVLLAIWQHCDRFDATRSTFANWVAGICRYKAIDYRRKWLNKMEANTLDSIEWMADNKADAALLEQELFEEMEQMLQCLAPDDQVLFRKLYLEEYSPEEVALELGMSRSNVYNRVSRGRKRIKEKYTER